jgi:hypothetical protein
LHKPGGNDFRLLHEIHPFIPPLGENMTASFEISLASNLLLRHGWRSLLLVPLHQGPSQTLILVKGEANGVTCQHCLHFALRYPRFFAYFPDTVARNLGGLAEKTPQWRFVATS